MNVKHSPDDMFLQITVARHYIEYNVSAARHSSNIAYTRNIVSMWNFISRTTEIEEIESPHIRKTRGDKLSNVGTFFSRLDHTAHYCSADSWRASRRRMPAKKRHQWKITGRTTSRRRRGRLRGESQLAFFNVETSSSLPALRDAKRENRKESHRKKLGPSASLDGHLQRSQIKSLKHLRAVPRVPL